ncbi:DUF927 domain-containing protein [Aeromonas lacus]|uniref:DUF927 domain-containing protein n=1 Tax=Aeromonas lacus TaxID=558884 RepID=UPI00051C0A9F|nr:DUF927 domain-containing protein [Aeromonas lacus]
MEFRLLPDGLEFKESERWVKLGGYINVLARTSSSDHRHSYGILLEWKNRDDVQLQDIALIRDLQGDKSSQVLEMLLDSGYQLEQSPLAWPRIRRYLFNETQRAEPATCAERTGWYAEAFVTPGWSTPRSNAKLYFACRGLNMGLRQSGTHEQWKEEIGKLCIGNPMLIFCCGVALSAPLLNSSGVENLIFHLYNHSESGKPIALNVAASLLGDESLIRTWQRAAHSLSAAAVMHHDIPLLLNELSQAKAEDVGTAVNSICSGSPKPRVNEESDSFAIGEHWRTIALSSGDVTLTEHMAQLVTAPFSGQRNRVVEIPVTGPLGIFDRLHGFKHPSLLADELQRRCKKYHGSLFQLWVDRLVSYEELELERKVSQHLSYRCDQIRKDAERLLGYPVSPQVMRVIQQFALVQAALITANHFELLPWQEHHSEDAVNYCFNLWLKNRGHGLDTEDYRLFSMLKMAIPDWGPYIRTLDSRLNSSVGYSRTYQGELQWLIKPDVLKQVLDLRPHYRSQIQRLITKNWFQFNDFERFTLNIVREKKTAPYFAIWPERIKKDLAALGVIE